MKGLSRKRLLGIVVGAVLLAVFVVLGLAGAPTTRGRLAPALPTTRLSGPAVTLAGLKGKPVIVTFWASWCGPCAREAPALQRFSEGLGGRAQLVGVNSSDLSSTGARSFISRYRWTFPNLRDAAGTVGNSYGIGNLPTTFLIDSGGRIRQKLPGPQTQQSLDQALAQLIPS